MRKKLSQERGVTIITVTTMVIVMLIIISTLVYYARNSVQMEALQGLKADISEIEAKALIYYVDNKAVPLKSTEEYYTSFQFGDVEFKNPNDSDMYYLVDLEKLGVTNSYNSEYYINEKTLTVYAKNPVTMNGKHYGRFKEDFVKFNDTDSLEIPDWARSVPPEIYLYDDNNYIVGVNQQYISSHSGNNNYYIDAINWRNLIIPAYGVNGSPVIGIATGAFSNVNINGGAIKIPFTVKIVSENVFGSGCNPSEIYCDANVVDVNAFSNITNCAKITIGPNCQIPDGNEVTGGAFSSDSTLKTIVIEGSAIGKYTFSRCQDVEDIHFLGSPSVMPEGAFYRCGFNNNVRIHTNANSRLNECVFPSSVTIFEPYCFMSSGIVNLVLPANTTEIGRGAFSNMPSRLSSVTFNAKLKVIGDEAFNYNTQLTTIKTGNASGFGSTLQSIGLKAFKTTGITSVALYSQTQYDPSDTFPTGARITSYN